MPSSYFISSVSLSHKVFFFLSSLFVNCWTYIAKLMKHPTGFPNPVISSYIKEAVCGHWCPHLIFGTFVVSYMRKGSLILFNEWIRRSENCKLYHVLVSYSDFPFVIFFLNYDGRFFFLFCLPFPQLKLFIE